MGVNPWNDTRGLFGAPQQRADYPGSVANTGAQSTPYIQQSQAQGGAPLTQQRQFSAGYQAPPAGATDAKGPAGSWAGITQTPEYQAQQQQNQQKLDQMNAANAAMGAEQAYANVGYQQDLAKLIGDLGLSADQTAWTKEGNQLQHDQAQALNNLIINNFGRDAGFIQRAFGLSGQLRDQDLARQGLSDQGYGLDEQDLLQNLYRSRRQLDNEYTGRGAWFAPERGLSHADLNQAWTTNQGRINIGRAGNEINRQTIGTQRGQDELARDKALAALGDENAKARLANEYGDKNLNYQNRGADLGYAQSAAGNLYQQNQLNYGAFGNALDIYNKWKPLLGTNYGP